MELLENPEDERDEFLVVLLKFFDYSTISWCLVFAELISFIPDYWDKIIIKHKQ